MVEKILIINSCGKAKRNSFQGQPTCNDLLSFDKRETSKTQFKHLSLPARDLYTGPQAEKIKKAVNILRTKFQVDYYIISAGFGLVNEMDEIPPYECTFSNKKIQEIRQMALELDIEKSIMKLDSDYDLIFLALGQTYLSTFNLGLLNPMGKEIIHFNRKKNPGKNFQQINDTVLVGKTGDNEYFPHKLGGLISTKGGIFLNYSDYIIRHSFIAFREWWQLIMGESIDTRPSISRSRSTPSKEKSKGIIPNYDHPIWSNQHMPSDRTITEAKRLVSELSESDVRKIQELSSGLNPPQRKSTIETYGDWVEPLTNHQEALRKYSEFFEMSINSIKNNTNDAKTKIQKALADAVRDRQEQLGLEQYLCNAVKISLFATALKYIKDPSKLKEGLPERRQTRTKKSKKKGRTVEYEIRIDKYGTSKNGLEIIGKIENKEEFPLQNMELRIQDTDGNDLMISNANGAYFEVASGKVHISFIGASMGGPSHAEMFRLEISSWANLSNGFNLITQCDNTLTKEKQVDMFEIKGE